MAEPSNAQPVTLSPEEDRFLRRFVRRHALLGPVGLLAVAALGFGLAALPRGTEPGEAPDGALADLRGEVADLRGRLESASGPRAGDTAQRERLAALERRIEAVAAELTGLRRRWETTAAVNPGAPPELASMLERLHALEQQDDRTEGDAIRGRLEALETAIDASETHRLASHQAMLDRLLALESRAAAPGSPPAAPAQ
jgi:hypothetical protein